MMACEWLTLLVLVPEQEQELALEKVEAWRYESRRPAAWPLNGGEASVRAARDRLNICRICKGEELSARRSHRRVHGRVRNVALGLSIRRAEIKRGRTCGQQR